MLPGSGSFGFLSLSVILEPTLFHDTHSDIAPLISLILRLMLNLSMSFHLHLSLYISINLYIHLLRRFLHRIKNECLLSLNDFGH